MTLLLQVIKYSSEDFGKCHLLVEGSEAGTLFSKPLNQGKVIIKCNKNNILKLKLYIDSSFNAPKAQNQFSAPRFIRENYYNPQFHNQESSFQYELPMCKTEEEKGTITFMIKYIKGQHYMGEKYEEFQTIPQRQPVKIYTGVSETRNLFNWLDFGTEDKRWKTVEPTYRDQSWGNP